MKNEPAAPTQPVEPTFDRTPQPFGSGPPDPIVCDASPRSLRQRTVNFAAKRMVDMLYVSSLDRETADRHFRWRPAAAPGDLASRLRPSRVIRNGCSPSRKPLPRNLWITSRRRVGPAQLTLLPQIVRSRPSNSMLESGLTTPQHYQE